MTKDQLLQVQAERAPAHPLLAPGVHKAGGEQVLGPPQNRRGAAERRDGRQVGEKEGAGGGGEHHRREHQGADQGGKRGEDPEGDVGAGGGGAQALPLFLLWPAVHQ